MYRKFLFSGIVAATVVISGACAAWPGFNWDEWLTLTGAVRPDLKTAQTGLPDLLPLLKNTPEDPRDFPTVTNWKKKRDRTVQMLRVVLGTTATMDVDRNPAVELGEEVLPEYRRIRINIPGEVGDPITSYLLIPRKPIARPTPAMIVLHQTQASGKAEACGLAGDPDMAFADELAKRGYICIAPDAIGFGERIPEGGQPYDGAMEFYKKFPNWSFFGRMSWDVSKVVDYLHTRGDVDKSRIGVIGHSHGAYGGVVSSVLEQRIALTVASCGFTMLRSDPTPERWSHLTPLMPLLGLYLDDIKQFPFEWHEVMACIAPRSFYNRATLDDEIFPNTANLAGVHKDLGTLYTLYNMDGKFHGELEPGRHQFPKEARERAYAWIDEQFKRPEE